MDIELALNIINWSLIALAVVAFAVMLVRGALHERALALGPTRDLGQGAGVSLAGVFAVLGYCAAKLALGALADPNVQMVLFFIPFALIGLMISRAVAAEAGLRKIGLAPRHPGRDSVWGAAGIFVGFGLAGLSGVVINTISFFLDIPVPEVAHEALRELRENFSTGLLVSMIISAVIIAPVMEELLFRGLLQTSWMRLLGGMRWPAIVLTAGVFSLTHCWVVPWQGLVPLFVLGLVFGYLYERTGSLLTPIIAHAGFNAMNIGIALAMPT